MLTVSSELDQLLGVFKYKLMFRNPESVRLKKLSTELFKFKSNNLMAKACSEYLDPGTPSAVGLPLRGIV